MDFDIKNDKGKPLIDVDAHIRLVSPEHLGGIKILRRGYNFTDGSDGFGHLDAGLFFIAFVRRPDHEVHPDAGAMSARRDQRVHHPHQLGRFRLPAGPSRG